MNSDLKKRLPLTWTAFFARHGSLTPTQQQAIPPILAGRNVLLSAPTASGKTEAALAPLIERHFAASPAPADADDGLRLLVICPTRALVRNLAERLTTPLAQLGITLGMKSGDTAAVSINAPPAVLVTTPESTDSLLTRAARLLATLDAVVLDEIHLFDGGVRGDHLRCLLRRIEYVRSYRAQAAGVSPAPLQRVALSATVPDPAGVAGRYLIHAEDATAAPPLVIEVDGPRRLVADLQALDGLDDLVTALALRAAPPLFMRKTLVFCNTRNEVEQTAAYLRRHLPFEAAVFVHYSNLDPALRREVEDGFSAATVAICVASSTLELGVDIGSIDDVVLLGPPPTLSSFLQRIGRGGRRSDSTHTLGLYRSPLEAARFHALLTLAEASPAQPAPAVAAAPAPFRPSVLVQQAFSLLKQSPTGGLRLADLRRVAPPEVQTAGLSAILRHLVELEYLRVAGLGEWRPAERLHELADMHEIYSNIGADPLAAQVVDAFSGRVLAQTERLRAVGERFLLGGRTLEVVWRDRYRLGVRRAATSSADDDTLRTATAPFAVPFDIAQAVAVRLGLARGELALVTAPAHPGLWLFHFWGDVYGALLAACLAPVFGLDGGEVTRVNEHCLRLPARLAQLPPWDGPAVERALARLMPQLQGFLGMGRFHSLLPAELAYTAARAQCDLPHFKALCQTARLVVPADGVRIRLLALLA